METQELRKIYHQTERLTLIILIISLPLFGGVYLYHNSGNVTKNLPELPELFNGFLLTVCPIILLGQDLLFRKKIKLTFNEAELIEKVKIYCAATTHRYLFLSLVSLGSTIGLLLSGNPFYIVIFALALVFFSLAKPSPDRMARLMKLKKEDRELLREIARPS